MKVSACLKLPTKLSASVWLVLAGSVAGTTLDDCRALAYTDRDAAMGCYQALLLDPSTLAQAEALWGLGNTSAANRAFRVAAAEAPSDADIRVRWAHLYRQVHQAADAEALFNEALGLDPAHAGAKLGLAEIALGRFEDRARGLISEVLIQDPGHAGAKLLLARQALEVGDAQTALDSLRGLVDSSDLGVQLRAMALLAAVDHVHGNRQSSWPERALVRSPGYGALFETVAHFYIITRRYEQAVVLLERAVTLDRELWSAHATLGINLLRLNRFDEARRHLTRAHDGDPYDAQVVNTLRLLDSLDHYDLFSDEELVLRTHFDETGALAPYVRMLVRDGMRVIGERYGYTSDDPVVIELYPHHDDFAVRTSGLPGIGILGATFGDVVVMDSPSARGIDEGFDWASALWHELAHVVTLGATDNLVSRWYSEGISVLEEWQTGPSARRSVPLSFITAYREDRLLPVAALDEGFIRPKYPGQIGVSYLQAGHLCEYIAGAYGDAGLTAILAAYHDGADTLGAIRRALEVEPDTLDADFAAFLEERFAGIDPAQFEAAIAEAARLRAAGDWSAAAAAAQTAISMYPGYIGPNGPYPLLARAEAELGHLDDAIAALMAYWRAGGRQPATLETLAGWLDAGGRAEDALGVRRSLALIAPLSATNRALLGHLLMSAGHYEEALAEYRAHLSLKPHDQADAHYRLARAYQGLGRTIDARQHVLYALEIAPRFGAALSLLLEINP